jgi:hypothetical protein
VATRFRALTSIFVAAMLAVAPAGAASAISPGEIVTFSGNVVSWTNGWVDHSRDQVNGNLMFICDDTVLDAACTFGGHRVAWNLRDGDTQATVCSTFDGSLTPGTRYKVRIVKHVSSVPTEVAVGFITHAACGSGGGSGSSSSGPAAAVVERFGTPAVGVALQASVGRLVEGTPVSFTANSMKTGSTYVLTVNSNPVILAEGVIADNGRISGLPRLPALPPGTHTLRLTTTGWDGSTAVISQVFVVGEDGRFTEINDPVGSVGAPATEPRTLPSTGVESTVLPWWALVMVSLGALLVLYSVRAQHMARRPEFLEALRNARTPWEVLATPIRVPGIDYSPSAVDSDAQALSLGEALRELDVAFSRIIIQQLARVADLAPRT